MSDPDRPTDSPEDDRASGGAHQPGSPPTDLPHDAPPGDAEWANPANWKLGLVYYAPGDPRAWVPKRSTMGRRRMGVTPNLARPETRRYLAWVLAVFGVLLAGLWVLERSGVLG